jgi:hypothetical protein
MSIRGTILMSLGGSIIVSLAWFGTGIIDYHRRLHGHGTGNYWPLAIFLAVQFFFLMLGLVRSQEPAELRA